MEKKNLISIVFAMIVLAFSFSASAQDAKEGNGRYIDVIGSCEMEIVPDEIHFVIAVKEYFEEEFDGKSEPRDYKTKVSIVTIEKNLRAALKSVGIKDEQIRVEEVGDYWRNRGMEFTIGKNFDITLNDFTMIDKIIKAVPSRGIQSMRIGELKNSNMVKYHEQGKVEALKAAQKKAAYLLDAIGEELGEVIYIKEPREGTDNYIVVNRKMSAAPGMNYATLSEDAASPEDEFKMISLKYTLNVRFAIADRNK